MATEGGPRSHAVGAADWLRLLALVARRARALTLAETVAVAVLLVILEVVMVVVVVVEQAVVVVVAVPALVHGLLQVVDVNLARPPLQLPVAEEAKYEGHEDGADRAAHRHRVILFRHGLHTCTFRRSGFY